MSAQTSIWLPWPPSVHKLYGKRPSGGKYRTKDYNRWRNEAGWLLKIQRPDDVPLPPVDVRIELTPPDRRRRDADNYEKAVLDLLVSLDMLEDDNSNIIRERTTAWAEAERPGVSVTITKAAKRAA